MTPGQPVIVVIEDDPQIRRFLRTGLQSHGFDVEEADSARSGLRLGLGSAGTGLVTI